MDREFHVFCHAGYRSDEYPKSILLHGRHLEIERIVDAWQSPEGRWFRVRCEDGRLYLLFWSRTTADWSLV